MIMFQRDGSQAAQEDQVLKATWGWDLFLKGTKKIFQLKVFGSQYSKERKSGWQEETCLKVGKAKGNIMSGLVVIRCSVF